MRFSIRMDMVKEIFDISTPEEREDIVSKLKQRFCFGCFYELYDGEVCHCQNDE